MRNKKSERIVCIILIGVLLFGSLIGCHKNVIIDDTAEDKSKNKAWEIPLVADLDPELSDAICFAFYSSDEEGEEDDDEENAVQDIVAVKRSGEFITLTFGNQDIDVAAFSANRIFYLVDNELYCIALAKEDDDYPITKIFNFSQAVHIREMAAVGNYLFYLYIDDENKDYIGRLNLESGKNDPEYLVFGYHGVENIVGLEPDKLVYCEWYGSKSVIVTRDINSEEEKILTKHGTIYFSINDKLIYGEKDDLDVAAYYEYKNQEAKMIAKSVNFWALTPIIPYQGGYLYFPGRDVYYFRDGINKKFLTVDKKYKDVENLFAHGDNNIWVYREEMMDSGALVLAYDLKKGTIKSKKIKLFDEETGKYYTDAATIPQVFYYLENKETERIEPLTEYIGSLKALDSGINYRNKAVVNSKSYLGKLNKGQKYDVYSYEPCAPYKQGSYLIEGWYLINVGGKKVYVADISELVKFLEEPH